MVSFSKKTVTTIFSLAALYCAASTHSAFAQTPYPSDAPLISSLSEVRIGALVHDIDYHGHFYELGGENQIDINAEVLFKALYPAQDSSFSSFLFSAKPHLGATFNTHGLSSKLYAGLTWDIDLSQNLFLEFSFGGAVHDGDLRRHGCAVSFRESLSLGYKLSEKWNILATADHISNANLCDQNGGLSSAGIRLGYKF